MIQLAHNQTRIGKVLLKEATAMATLVSGLATGQPMGEMNTTPLIDVMLVLLIMFIITIPVATHSVDFNLGSGAPVDTRLVHSDVNRLELTVTDRIVWNGREVTEPQLTTLLNQTARLPVEPELRYEPQGHASYDLAARITGTIKRAGITNFGFVGNERYAQFGKVADTQ